MTGSYTICYNTRAEWEGIDTLIVAAGVSALRPVLEIAGLESIKVRGEPEDFDPPQADAEAIRRVVDVNTAAMKANCVGPLIAAVTFVSLFLLKLDTFSRASGRFP